MTNLFKTLLIISIVWIHAILPAHADYIFNGKDSVHTVLYDRFIKYYNENNRAAFHKAAEELGEYYREHDAIAEYYKIQLNICLYDTEHNKTSEAMTRANDMLKEMEEEKFNAYSQVYTALGTIYESRGNYRMARYYYEQGLENLPPEDKSSKSSIYARMAYLLMFRQPVDAKRLNEKYYEESLQFPQYHQVYHFVNGMIDLALGDEYDFRKSYDAYHKFHAEHPELDNYGKDMLEVANLAFQKHYDKALNLLDSTKNVDLNRVSLYDMRIIINKMMGNVNVALDLSRQRAECIDSLNTDLLFDNLNQINAETGLSIARQKASDMREYLFITIILLALVIIGLLGVGFWHIRKQRFELKATNEQLKMALSMAEEGERMKSQFVRSVSHEIRTPLNAINGFNELLNSPSIELPEEERAKLLQRIKENVQAITTIVDEMLRVADKESNDFDPHSSQIYCNQFFSSLLYKHRGHVNSNIDLDYTTRVINRFQITSSKEGLTKIIDQLMQNAIKFTTRGSIKMHCELTDNEQKLLLSITDTGKGIAPEARDKIFQGFYKVDAFKQGIGLGLTVSKKIAQKLGGDLTLDEDYTNGARFVLSLPVT